MDNIYEHHMRTLREKLNDVVDTLPAENVMLSTVLEIMGREGELLIVVFLALPFMVPVSLPGMSTALGAVILLIGLCLVRNRQLWLPRRLLNRRLNAGLLRDALQKGVAWLGRLEKISHQRLPWLSEGQVASRINGFMIIVGALLLMAPFGFVPLSNTLPGIGLLFLAIGMLQKDGWCIVLGYLFTVVTILYFTALVGVGVVAAQTGLDKVIQWLN
jgi:hypothetical protein